MKNAGAGIQPDETLAALARELQGLGNPIVVFNKSHSGSRLLAAVLAQAGVFMGSERNESNDAVVLFPVVEELVRRYYPDYSPLWKRPGDPALARLVCDAFGKHLSGHAAQARQPWGWKLCETGYVLPVIDALFPGARYVHLIRDGRDVAFCDHRGPVEPFWRKVYFDTDRLASWHGLDLTAVDYRRRSHLYNALHWVNAVRVGRAFSAMLRDRCLEVRYEDLCSDFPTTVRNVLHFVGVEDAAQAVIDTLAPTVRYESIGKHRAASARRRRQVLAIERPLLLSLGYLHHDPVPPRPTARALLYRALAIAARRSRSQRARRDQLDGLESLK